MKIQIKDYSGSTKVVDLGESKIKTVTLTVLSGDEILTVDYDEGHRRTFDSSNDRMIDFFDDVDVYSGADLEAFLKEREAK